MKLAIIGGGYWGKNLIRCLNSLNMLDTIYDINPSVLASYKAMPLYKDVEMRLDYTDGIHRQDLDGFVVATPPHTHYEITKALLKAKRDVFLEKPMTLNTNSSKELHQLAKDNGCVLLIGHIFLYAPEIIKLKEIINSDSFGDIKYIYTQRLNLGKVQDCGVTFDLAAHDISIVNYLLDAQCISVKSHNLNNLVKTIPDVSFNTFKYPNGVEAQSHLSWLDPRKVRDTVVVGSKQMAVCDSLNKKIIIYNNSVIVEGNESYADHIFSYKYGDVTMPFINASVEPMIEEIKDFVHCINTGDTPKASSQIGVEVVQVLNALKEAAETGQEVMV